MKKTGMFVIIACLLFCIGIGYSLSIMNSLNYHLEDVQGDRQALQDHKVQFRLALLGYRIDVSAQKDGVSTNIIRAKNSYDDGDSYVINALYEAELDNSKQWLQSVDPIQEDWVRYYQKVDRVALNYEFSIGTSGFVEIDTGLHDDSNEYYTYYQNYYIHKNDPLQDDPATLASESPNIIQETNEQVDVGNIVMAGSTELVAGDEGIYYLLPKTGDFTTGVNHVYQMVATDTVSCVPLIALPEQRNYTSLHVVDDSLLVVSQKDTTLFIDKYDTLGNLQGSWSQTFDPSIYIRNFTNDHYLTMFNALGAIQVFDTSSMSIVSEETVTVKSLDLLHDIQYSQGVLYHTYYLLDIDGFPIGYTIDIRENGEVLYQGNIRIVDDSEKDYSNQDVKLNESNIT